jgi:5-methyltetrahydropteroyltriglutamate--homocysteine methyltransferase
VPVKQAVISPSALSLLYPQRAIPGYSREEYLDAMLHEQEGEIRRCLQKSAHAVQIDFTEGRLSIKLDPTGRLLRSFIDLNNLLLERFRPKNESELASIPVTARTATRATARGSTMRSYCPACSN